MEGALGKLSPAPMGPQDYRNYVGLEFERPRTIGWTTIPVLEFLNGRPWDADALNVVYALAPSYLRVITHRGEESCDARTRRVTVYLDVDDRIVRIEQEVAVGLVGRENGQDVSQYIRGDRAITDDAAVLPPIPASRR